LKGTLGEAPQDSAHSNNHVVRSGNLMLILGVGALVFVPIFKTLTHMPPYIGILLGLGVLWVVSELINPELDEAVKKNFTVAGALARIDVPSVLFFLGILLAVGALESMQILHHLASWLDHSIGDQRIIVTLIGLLSAIVDNVPLVAASMGMYSMDVYYMDHMVWEYLAYCAGTGGSILIIGSAAGVAAMGIEKIDFIWYMKKISLLVRLRCWRDHLSDHSALSGRSSTSIDQDIDKNKKAIVVMAFLLSLTSNWAESMEELNS
jgi:Na+/H+ antiporter NhaD/arsenite permease-like protein